jgi:hypothetical protein
MTTHSAPDPFALEFWRANRLPSDPAKHVWLLCALLSNRYGWPFLTLLESMTPGASVPRA